MPPRPTPAIGRVMRRVLVDLDTGCWLYQGADNGEGYGVVYSQGRVTLVHRVMYEALVEPIPEGMFLDHLCRLPICCNPAHLEVVSPKENVQRGLRGQLHTICAKGHALTPANTVVVNKGRGRTSRRCKTCRVAELRRGGRSVPSEWGVG